MKFLLDERFGRSATALFNADGHDCVHVGDVSLTSRADSLIPAYATSQERVIVTLDGDFHALLAKLGAAGPSVLRFRMDRLRASDLHRLLTPLLAEYADALTSGVAMSVDESGVRLRTLPLR